MGSFYQKEFTKVNIPIPTEVYIHEKHKNHRNSHKMDCTTQNQVYIQYTYIYNIGNIQKPSERGIRAR